MSTSMRSVRFSPLTTRVLLWVIGISALVFTVVTIATAWQENRQLYHVAQENARRNVERSLPAISSSLWNFDRPSLDATLMALTQSASIVKVQVLDGQRKVLAEGSRSADSATPESEWEVPIETPDGSKWTLRIAESYQEVRDAFVRNVIVQLLSELVKTISLAALLFLVVYWLITRHIQSVVQQVANLGTGNVAQSIALRRRPRRDELDTLVDSINRFRAERNKAEEALLDDIAERKRIEGELKQTQTELSEALQIAQLAYWEYDGAIREFTFNDQYYTLHRISVADAGGYSMHLDDFCGRLVHPQDAQALKAYIEDQLQAVSGGEPSQLEMRILCADGAQRWTLLRSSVERGERADAVRLIGAVQDITERKRAEEALRSMQADLVRVTHLSTMGQMAASIAHEINQPLAAIVANANAGLRWLANKTPDLDEARAALSRIVGEGHRAGKVITGIRAMFRKDDQEKTLLDLNQLIQEVVALLQGDILRRDVAVQLNLAEDLPLALANRVQLQQVVLNLIANALDAMSSVNDRARVLRLTSARRGSAQVLVTVEDSGSGIDPERIDRIFDAFFTTKSDGMGMGLSICRSIIEAHGGRLSALPDLEVGSIFQIILPAAESSAANDL